jgi:hypothetical protein
MASLSIKDLAAQLRADLIGKDSQRGVSLTYSWLANQFGHFSLGFIPTSLLYILVVRNVSAENGPLWPAWSVALVWLLFEIYNVLASILWKTKSGESSEPPQQTAFKPAWGNILLDTFTDLCFFGLGSFVAAVVFASSATASSVALGLAAFLAWSSFRWYLTKMYQQEAQYPFQFRLSQWDQPIAPRHQSEINHFLKIEPGRGKPGTHLLVFGGGKKGKTKLSVGIANELSIRHRRCAYITAMKLFGMLFESDADILKTTGRRWTWRSASFLVIDDVNPGSPIPADVILPGTFSEFFRNSAYGAENLAAINKANVIWVLGSKNHDNYEMTARAWTNLLVGFGVQAECIKSINLDE